MKNHHFLLFAAMLTLVSCASRLYQPQESIVYTKYSVQPGKQDTGMQQLVAPYAVAVNKTMLEIIGTLAQPLEKKQPENTLGYFMTDAFLTEARQSFDTHVDVALMNTGGIRTNQMPAGNISVGAIYEAMPFDNLLILLTLNGKQLQMLLNHVAGRGGWPISGGRYIIENKTATQVLIAGEPVDADKKYVVAVSDYIANGGDDCNFLVGLPQQNKGYLQRDALIDYVKRHTAAGKKVTVTELQRVRLAQ